MWLQTGNETQWLLGERLRLRDLNESRALRAVEARQDEPRREGLARGALRAGRAFLAITWSPKLAGWR